MHAGLFGLRRAREADERELRWMERGAGPKGRIVGEKPDCARGCALAMRGRRRCVVAVTIHVEDVNVLRGRLYQSLCRTTTLQSQPMSNGICCGCFKTSVTFSLTISHTILGPGQLLIGGTE